MCYWHFYNWSHLNLKGQFVIQSGSELLGQALDIQLSPNFSVLYFRLSCIGFLRFYLQVN